MVTPNEIRREDKEACCHSPSHQAFQLLRFAFTVAPILAGLDKFLYLLTNWEQYLSPQFSPFFPPHTTMMIVGAIEIIAGIGVWIFPRIFSYIVALWLLAIIVNLLLLGRFYDIALRDFGLMLGALALARLSSEHCCSSACTISKS